MPRLLRVAVLVRDLVKDPAQLGVRNRLADQIALHLVAAEQPQDLRLVFGLDAFRDNLEAQRMRERFPGLRIAGTHTPPFKPVDELSGDDTVELINRAEPDIVWVGISTPKQELWMARMRARLTAPVLIGVGAAFDFHSGTVAQAPSWMQRSGLEWLFRLAHEPRRLWRRYLVDNPWFLFELAQQKLGLRRYELT